VKLNIEIELDNDAFDEGNCGTEAARILRRVAINLDGFNRVACEDHDEKLRDINGNTVGFARVTED
jgi:hypothetical protein